MHQEQVSRLKEDINRSMTVVPRSMYNSSKSIKEMRTQLTILLTPSANFINFYTLNVSYQIVCKVNFRPLMM